MSVHLIDMHLTDMYHGRVWACISDMHLIGIEFMSVRLVSIRLIGMRLMGMHIMRGSHRHVPVLISYPALAISRAA